MIDVGTLVGLLCWTCFWEHLSSVVDAAYEWGIDGSVEVEGHWQRGSRFWPGLQPVVRGVVGVHVERWKGRWYRWLDST